MHRAITRPLHLRAQKLLLEQCFPEAKTTLRKNTLVWEGRLQPTAVSHRYRIRISYGLGRAPEIILVEPNAQNIADGVIRGRRPPHIYSVEPFSLCVYHPKKREWKSSQPLATTIVPWTSMWLSYFEDWVYTDVWSGGGEHPEIELPQTRALAS